MSHMYNSLGPKKHGKFWILWDTLQKAQLLALSLVRLVYSTVFSHPLTNQSTPLLPRPMGNQLLHNHLLLTSAPIIHLRPKWDPGKHRDGAVSRAMWYLFGTSGHRVGIHIHIYIHIYIYTYTYIIIYIHILYQDFISGFISRFKNHRSPILMLTYEYEKRNWLTQADSPAKKTWPWKPVQAV